MINYLKTFISINKWRMQVGYSYLGMIGVGLVIAKTVQDIFRNVNINIPFYVLFLLGIIALWLFGFIADKYGIYSAELNYSSKRNPYFEKHLRRKE